MTVGWGPNSDTNNVQDSVILNYPPSGIQTLGFIALQFTGDVAALDAQGNPWSERVQAPPVTITGPQNLTIYPDNYGCAFAQVLPSTVGNTYTVSVANASSGVPAGSTYGSPSFVANTTGTVTNHVLQQPTSESLSGIAVNIGAVTKLDALYPTTYPGYDQGSTINLSYPSSSSVEDGVECPGAGWITCVSTGENSSGAVVTWNKVGAWSNIAVPGTVSRISSVACNDNECVGVGYGGGSGVILDATTGFNPSLSAAPNDAAALTGVTSLTQVTCPSDQTCVAIGTTAIGAAVLTDSINNGTDNWSAVTLPAGITGLTSLVCPQSGTGCAAMGTTSSPSNGTPVVVSGGYSGSWVLSTATGFTVSSLSSFACPSDSACVAIGTGTVGAGASGPIAIAANAAGGLGASGLAWTADSFPAGTTVTSLTGLTCPAGNECLLTGAGTQGAGTVPLVLEGGTSGGTVFGADTLPPVGANPVSTVGSMVCPSSSTCVLLATAASAPAILSGAITGPGTADTWTSAAVPSVSGTLSALNQVVCPTTTNCAAIGYGTNASSQPTAFLLASSGGTTSWSSITLPTTNPAWYLSDIDCTKQGYGTYCSAVGAGPLGVIELSTTSGPSGPWSDQTPVGLAGSPAPGIPVEENNTGLLPNPFATVVTAGASPNITQLSDVYPFNSGYGLFAGDCSAEIGAGSFNVAQAATVPGGATSVTVPLGLVTVQALHASGALVGLPYAGATFSLTATTGGCAGDAYTLQSAGPDGLSRTEVPFGTYNLTVTGTSSTTVPITVGGSTVSTSSSATLVGYPVTVSVP